MKPASSGYWRESEAMNPVLVRGIRRPIDKAAALLLHCRYIMNATIQKWGNSLAVRIPQAVARQMGVVDGDAVSMEVSADRLVLRPAKPSYRLADLVRRIRPGNRPGETEWGQPVGKEVW